MGRARAGYRSVHTTFGGNMTTAPSTDQHTGDTSVTEEGRHVTGVAKEEAGNVAAEAKDQVVGLLDQARSQVSEQSGVQRDRLVQTLTTLSGDLDHMAEQSDRPGMATDLAREAARRARELGHRLDGREPQQILDDVRTFARRRPGTFLLGALAAGVLAGRLTRGARESQSSSGSPSRSRVSGTGTGFDSDTLDDQYVAGGRTEGAFAAETAVGHPTSTSPAAPTVEVQPSPDMDDDPLDSDIPHDRGSL
jgi:uncharacterized protein YjbJ (UPF0337 family)